MSCTDYHISMISGMFEPKIIGDTNDHININLEQVPDKFTELTHDGTALKPSIMQYLLDNDWQYEVTAKKCLQLNL